MYSSYTHPVLTCHELPGKLYTHTTPHHVFMPQLSFPFSSARSATSFPFQNRQRNRHVISNDRLMKDISWCAYSTKRPHSQINRKSGGDFVGPASVHWSLEKDKLNNWKLKKNHWVIQFVYLSIQLTTQTPNVHFMLCRECLFCWHYCERTLRFLGKGTLWCYQQFFSFWLVMIVTFVFIVNTQKFRLMWNTLSLWLNFSRTILV